MLCVWWDRRSIIHFKLLNHNGSVTANVYIQQLQRVHQSLLEKLPTLINRKNVVLLHDNARPHTARVTQEKFWSSACLFYLTHHTHLTLRLPIIIFLDHCKALEWGQISLMKTRFESSSRTFSRQNRRNSTQKKSKSSLINGNKSLQLMANI